MRDPSIHIKKSDLFKVFQTLKIEMDIPEFMKECNKYTIYNRQVLQVSKQEEKQLQHFKEYATPHVKTFNYHLEKERRRRKHRVRRIHKTSKQYPTLVKISANANQFCELFNINKDKGFKLYINRALDIMPKYTLNRFIYYHDKIITWYEDLEFMKKHPLQALATDIKDYYKERTGLTTVVSEVPFYMCAEIVDELNCNYTDYVDAQFDGMEWLGVFPTPTQLTTDKAKERYQNSLLKTNKSELPIEYLNRIKHANKSK